MIKRPLKLRFKIPKQSKKTELIIKKKKKSSLQVKNITLNKQYVPEDSKLSNSIRKIIFYQRVVTTETEEFAKIVNLLV